MADSITIQNNNIMPLVDDLRQIINQRALNTESKLCRQCLHNCSQNMVTKDSSHELFVE